MPRPQGNPEARVVDTLSTGQQVILEASAVTDENKKPIDPIPSDLVRANANFEDLVQTFVDGLGQRIHTMEQALNKGDVDALKQAAHQLKGTGGGHGYAILSEMAAQMEQDTVNGDLDAVRQDLDELKIIVSRVVVRLD
jgi:HPt (histidine-containing phosphotransfer) domain-containing protein